MEKPTPIQRHGFVALLGRPNVGKSTLFNCLLGKRVAAVTHKAQTTRCNIRGVIDDPRGHIMLLDTPGAHRGQRHQLNSILNRNVSHAIDSVNICLLIAEYNCWKKEDKAVLGLIKEYDKPCLLLLNKIDRLRDKTRLLKQIDTLKNEHTFADIIPISALSNQSNQIIKKAIYQQLPENSNEDLGPVTATPKFLITEFIREQLMTLLHQEVPYASHVEVMQYEKRERHWYALVHIIVERESQRAIIIGRGGRSIKNIGTQARQTLETLLKQPMYLELQVKVNSAWRNDPNIVKSYLENLEH